MLVSRLIDEGRDFAQAEVTLYTRIAKQKASASAAGIGMIAAALLLVQAALTVLLAALGHLVARWIGPVGGFAFAGAVGLLLAFVLVKLGLARLRALGGTRS